MMSRNPERLDRVEMFGRLWSKDFPGLAWAGPAVPGQQNCWSQTMGWRWWYTLAAVTQFAEEVEGQVAEEEGSSAVEEEEASGDVDAGRVAGDTAPCTP